ncbi:MAG: maleylpyruvate isomerase family mycothiol-dependent enzyme [Actinomycetia bacterium]|nr:maleylpyruvate isomerase family mycothiol-dependent enzyme [Actinomycetes bacterium]
MTRLQPDEYKRLVTLEATRLARVNPDSLTNPVPHLEGWTVHNVIGHTAWVCRYVTQCLAATAEDPPSRSSVGEPPFGPTVIDWLGEAVSELEEALADCDLDIIRPTWTGPQPASWWLRRLSHELAVHRWDVFASTPESTSGPEPIDAPQALDGIDETLDVFVPNRMQFDKLDGRGQTVHLHATDIDNGEWMLELCPDEVNWSHGHAKGDTAARATSSDLMLLLWSRIRPESVEVFGDRELLDRWQAAAAF